MKKVYIISIVIWTLFAISAPVRAQTSDDSIFILERKSLALAKNWTKWTGKMNTLANSGFIWRLETGYFAGNQSENETAVLPFSLEGGYKFHFVELGVKHVRTGPALGTDLGSFIGSSLPGSMYSYSLARNVNLQASFLTFALHIPIGKVPVRFNYGLGGFLVRDNFSVAKTYFLDGSHQWGSGNSMPTERRNARYIGINFSTGPMYGGVSYYRTTQTINEFKYKNYYFDYHIGWQMSTGKGKGLNDMSIASTTKKSRITVGFSDFGGFVPLRQKATYSGTYIDFGLRLNDEWGLMIQQQLMNFKRGTRMFLPDSAAFSQGFDLPKWQPKHKTLFSVARYINTGQKIEYTVQGGPIWEWKGENRPQVVVWPQKVDDGGSAARAGLHVGVGAHYRFLHTHLNLMKIQEKPIALEWGGGVRLHLFRRTKRLKN